MIIYKSTLGNFIEDVKLNIISDKLLDKLRELHLSGGGDSEVNSWNNSLHFMKDVLDTPEISKECDVAVEYNIPNTSKRVDFMISGQSESKENHLVIVELKQWAKVDKVDDISKHSVLSDLRKHEPTAHPSYQAYSYKSLISNYCDNVNILKENINPCAYLHNLNESYRKVLEDPLYKEWVEEAPVFLKNDVLKLRNFLIKYIGTKSSDGRLLYEIDFGRIKPQKYLQDSLDSMLSGNEEFKMIDEQVVAYDLIMKSIIKSLKDNKKHVFIVQGGPGTGKSVLAINLLANCISKLKLNASYITKNSAPRNCYSSLLAKGNAKKEVDLKLAIRSPFSLPHTPNNGIDVGIFDEAHRLQKSPFMYPGKDMLMDAINACKVSIFFVDEGQRITVKDCYSIETIYAYARLFDAVIDTPTPFKLTSQFRCNGSNGYIELVDIITGKKEFSDIPIDLDDFDLRVFDNPNDLRNELRELNKIRNKCRMVAGYCYDWNVKTKKGDWDIILPYGFKAKWNLEKDAIWAINKSSFEEIGCIHTCQGMEFDYVGVFIGKDLMYKDGKVITNQEAISRDDKTNGIRSCKNKALADMLIRNTYKVLLTRGQKGCFIYCEDDNLREFINKLINDVKMHK